jgi:hypothetical protein
MFLFRKGSVAVGNTGLEQRIGLRFNEIYVYVHADIKIQVWKASFNCYPQRDTSANFGCDRNVTVTR